MNRIDRKTLFTIIAAGATLTIFGLIIVISFLTSQANSDPDITPNPTITSPAENEVTETGVEGNPDDGGADTIYQNDYSADEGYEKLPTDFDPAISVTDNTVYNDAYVALTGPRLLCEFSNKKTITTRSLESIENFYSDLGLSGSAQALSSRAMLSSFLKKYKGLIDTRLSAKEADELKNFNCDYGNLDHEHPAGSEPETP